MEFVYSLAVACQQKVAHEVEPVLIVPGTDLGVASMLIKTKQRTSVSFYVVFFIIQSSSLR